MRFSSRRVAQAGLAVRAMIARAGPQAAGRKSSHRIRFNLFGIQSGDRAPLTAIGFLIDVQFGQLNMLRTTFELHLLEQYEIIFIGKHFVQQPHERRLLGQRYHRSDRFRSVGGFRRRYLRQLDTSKMLLRPMPGVVTPIAVKEGDHVETGQAFADHGIRGMRTRLRKELGIFGALLAAMAIMSVLDIYYVATAGGFLLLTGVPTPGGAPLWVHVMNMGIRGFWAAVAYGAVMKTVFGGVSVMRVTVLWCAGLSIIALLGTLVDCGALPISSAMLLGTAAYIFIGQIIARDWVSRWRPRSQEPNCSR